MVYSMLCSLNFIHSANVMHRDIKPQNFLLKEDGSVVLCDFGYARAMPAQDLQVPKDKKMISEKLKQTKSVRESRPRAISPHVVTRWYRPPEVILLEKDYNNSVDIWSSACVISEILACSKEYQRIGFIKKRRQMFRGKSCYPLSPASSDTPTEVDHHDQLISILELLGKLSSEDMSFFSNENQKDYVKKMMSTNSKVSFEAEYCESDTRLAKILKHMY